MTKAIIDFSGYTGPELTPVAQMIHDQMTANAVSFDSPPLTMAELQADITAFDSALMKKATGAYADTVAFNIARHELESALADLGNFVNTVASGDAMLVEKSGFPNYETGRTPDFNPPAAPENLRLRQGDLSGTLVARYRPARARSINEVQTNLGDPNTAADWKPAGMF